MQNICDLHAITELQVWDRLQFRNNYFGLSMTSWPIQRLDHIYKISCLWEADVLGCCAESIRMSSLLTQPLNEQQTNSDQVRFNKVSGRESEVWLECLGTDWTVSRLFEEA